MNTQGCNQDKKIIEKFTPIQKFFMRLGLYGALIVGGYGIYVQSIMWGLIYTAFIFLGTFPLLSCFCSHWRGGGRAFVFDHFGGGHYGTDSYAPA